MVGGEKKINAVLRADSRIHSSIYLRNSLNKVKSCEFCLQMFLNAHTPLYLTGLPR